MQTLVRVWEGCLSWLSKLSVVPQSVWCVSLRGLCHLTTQHNLFETCWPVLRRDFPQCGMENTVFSIFLLNVGCPGKNVLTKNPFIKLFKHKSLKKLEHF